MLTVEQNEELTKVGPGTPMGELLRRYWYPIAFEQDFDSVPPRPCGCSARTGLCSRRPRAASTASSARPARTAARH